MKNPTEGQTIAQFYMATVFQLAVLSLTMLLLASVPRLAPTLLREPEGGGGGHSQRVHSGSLPLYSLLDI